jgi:hypothetical protein
MKPSVPSGDSPPKGPLPFNTFSYYDNRKSPPVRLLIVGAHNILEADELFNAWSKLNVVKCPWIGCRIDEPRA